MQRSVVCGALVLSLSGCSFVLDRKETQCTTDADCVHFGMTPLCKAGLCVVSGLGPEGCFDGTPAAPEDFLNSCTTASSLPYDNCAHLGLCSPDQSALPAVTEPTLTQPPLAVNAVTVPSIPCQDPSRPNIIYMEGSTSFVSLVKPLSALMLAGSPSYTIVWQSTSSCAGADSIFSTDPTKHVINNVLPSSTSSGNYAFFYDAEGAQNFCLLPVSGATVEVGESDIYATTCNSAYATSDTVAGYLGPISTVTFVVPSSSTQLAISAEAAHLVFGLGGDSNKAAPWTDPNLIFIRSSGTGTVQLPSRVIDVPPTSWWGIDRLSASNLRDSLIGVDPASAEGAIGVLTADFSDGARKNLRELYFQSLGQLAGFLPDSTPDSIDRANVRDGHYPIWGPTHLYTAISNGVPSQSASALVSAFSAPRLDAALLDGIIAAGFVPSCAMNVTRTSEVGPVTLEAPQFGCGCYFDFKTTGQSSCQACTNASDCPGTEPSCNSGFCEVK